eukprot:TRINITY_DN24155_c0_g1_i1.p1 TRINITY_DN24155_c0_g1~~TRINITY_DN24155_c0_g1_i1.p1  ORF type:complete len:294 (+),score=108.18 TRINITY_DN24155_c0_g1_i1:52-882(+)
MSSASPGGSPGPFSERIAGEADDDTAQRQKWQDIQERRSREQQNYSRSQKATAADAANPRCFLDVSMGSTPLGRIYVELFADATPLTAENFRALCTGECGFDEATGVRLDLVDAVFHRVMPSSRKGGGFVVAGDLVHGTGAGGASTFGQPFVDESFRLRHSQPGLLSMVSRGPNCNTSQFCITTTKCPHLDYRQVVFGRVTDGLSVVEKIEHSAIDRNCVPKEVIRITFSGQQNKTAPYRPPMEQSRVSAALQPRKARPDSGDADVQRGDSLTAAG